MHAAKTYRGQEFGVGDIAHDVDCPRGTVQRALNDLTELGYLAKRETKNGLAI
ncbi:MAG TPA: helix-turn-helix domain-containing protein [Halococcus sp.]|nr:helix-turn-helix domain-containing protein [Halococcus sp.]